MENETSRGESMTTEAIESLRLPETFDDVGHRLVQEIDALIDRTDVAAAELDATLVTLGDESLARLISQAVRKNFLDEVIWLSWPDHLYIPRQANPRDYWPTATPPANHLYSESWVLPRNSAGTNASIDTGTLFSYSALIPSEASTSRSSTAGLGIIFQPDVGMGVVRLQPEAHCAGVLRTALEFFPQIAAGYVNVEVELILAAWVKTAAGLSFLGSSVFSVASSGRRDQSFGAERRPFQATFKGPGFSTSFTVQRGQSYLFGVANRIKVTSTLTTSSGQPLVINPAGKLNVWGYMSCFVPHISVVVEHVIVP